jgi:hypothetical protein
MLAHDYLLSAEPDMIACRMISARQFSGNCFEVSLLNWGWEQALRFVDVEFCSRLDLLAA